MKKILLLLLTLLPAATAAGHAASQPILMEISKTYDNNSAQLSCSLSSIPQYTINSKEKRIDLILENTIAADNLALPETDNKIVKILSLAKGNTTTISLFFRYPPQKATAASGRDLNKLVFTIVLGNEFTSTRPILVEKSNNATAPQPKTKDLSNPVMTSPYPGKWKNFLKEYEADLQLELPVQFSFVSFPAITLLPPELEENIIILPSEIIEGGRSNRWNDLIPLITEQLDKEKDADKKKKLTLTYGEIILRSGNYKEAYKQFYLISNQYAKEPIGILAKYLLARLQAEYADPFLADIELQELESVMDKNNPATPYFNLTQIETALATKQLKRMQSLLERSDISYPADIAPLKALRQADYWLATGEFIKAHAGYQLLNKSGILADYRSSLNGYCSTLYRHKQFKQAVDCYDQLAKKSINSPAEQYLGMISFRKAMAKLHISAGADMINDFSQLEMVYPDSEAGIRAALKQTDLKLLTLKNWEKPALTYYQPLAETAPYLSIREEATFKEALVYQMLDQKAKSVELLTTFLRDFKTGGLHDTALALLIDVLPGLLKEQIKDGKYIEALVLAKQNKFLFTNNWIDSSLLADMAEAYRQLGFFNEASKVYIYLLDVSSEEKKAPYYLPLIKLAFEQGDSEVIEEYADQYSLHYPKGQDQEEILYMRLQNLMTHNKYQEALTLISGKKTQDPKFKFLQASLSFHLNDYAKTKTILEEMQISSATKQPDHLFMLAESTYQLGDLKKAEELFIPLQQDLPHKEQALFRLAEIARENGQKERALKLFAQVVETGSNPFWKKLAKKELELTALSR